MHSEDIDDLFRSQLGGHETPPGADLWARLQAGSGADPAHAEPTPPVAPERVDQLFRQHLHTHPTPPRRELWERLEDEHLRPRKRRAAAWWPMAVAAALALLLLAGGAGLWRGFPGGSGAGSAGTVASQPGSGSPVSGSNQQPVDKPEASRAAQPNLAANTATETAAAAAEAASRASATSREGIAQESAASLSGLGKKNLPGRATRPAGLASSASKAGTVALQAPRRRPQGTSRQPDAAAASTPLVARTLPHSTSASARPADEPAPVVATTTPVAPAPEIVRPETTAPAALATSNSVITVDVRSGAPKRPTLATAVASAAAAAPERRGLGGRLLQQVGHAVRGERLSLAEVTGLPENLTLEANIVGRHVSKSIQL